MEEILKLLMQAPARLKLTDEEMWKLEELLDEYIDKRIERALEPYDMRYRDRY